MNKEKIGALISALRKEKGLTQRELAERLHVSDRTVSKWERGAGLPDPSVMITLAEELGITVNELLAGERAPEGSPESGEEAVREAVSVLVRHVKQRERTLRKRILAGVLCAAAVAGIFGLLLKKLGEDRILAFPDLVCEVRQRDADVSVAFTVDRSMSGVYDYICAYETDRYGNVYPTHRRVWQSYTDAVPKEVYKALQEVCPGEITRITKVESGYLVGSYETPRREILTEVNESLALVYQYEKTDGLGIATAFLQGEMLYVVSYTGEEGRVWLTAVNKTTGAEETDSFVYRDFVPGAEEEDLGGFLWDGANMWVRDGKLFFAKTYYGLKRSAVFGCYDLERDRAVSFDRIEEAQVVAVRKEPEQGRVAVLVNPMHYRPLELHVLDDETMEALSTTPLELPPEFLSRQYSDYAARTYLLHVADMDEQRVAVLFGDAINGESLLNGIDEKSTVLSVYDRQSGEPLWRGRFLLSERYEIDSVELLPE